MGATGISEFTFGFAFLFEQVNQSWDDIKVAPILPSLQQENEQGWDTKLPINGIDYYYQFKLTDYLHAAHAKFIRDGTYTDPYFRIKLHRKEDNKQHNLLHDLSQNFPDTYYVAPEIIGIDDFNDAFANRQVKQNTRIIKVNECDEIPDGEQHYITFQFGSSVWRQHSKVKTHETSFSGADLEKTFAEKRNQSRRIDVAFAKNLFENHISKAEEIIRKQNKQSDKAATSLGLGRYEPTRTGYLLRTAEILSIFYGVTMVIIGDE